MKSFTAKEFSRCPAKVYEAAREDGCVEITHDRFSGTFRIEHLKKQSYDTENDPPFIRVDVKDLDLYNKGFINMGELKRREIKRK